MNRTALALTLVLAMIMCGVQAVKVVEANFYPFGIPTVELLSPQAFPYIYVTSNVDISFNYNAQKNLTQVASFSYSLDKNANVTLTSEITDLYSDYNRYSVFETLENLANGNHTLNVYAYFTNKTVSPIIDITVNVDTAFNPPKPSIISPINQTTYNTREVPLTYTIDSKIFHSYYSLDTANYAIGRIEFTGNTTLTNLSEGAHKLRLSLETESHSLLVYDYFFLTVSFTVDSNQTIPTPTPSPEPTSKPEPFPATLFLVASVGIALGVIGLLVYFKKLRKDSNS